MTDDFFASGFSTPMGGGQFYPPPPYSYRGVQDLIVSYETDAGTLAHLLPPGVTVTSDPVRCSAVARWVPFSTFGAYHECFVTVEVMFAGTEYRYQPFIFTDTAPPLAAGREIWGYPKKLAQLDASWSGGSRPGTEQLLFTVERPARKRLVTISLACERPADPSQMRRLPVLSLKHIPSAEPDRPPEVAQLVAVDVRAVVHRSTDGSPRLWSGRASLTMDSPSEVDPWYTVAPTRITGGWFAHLDFELGHGTIVHDFVSDGWFASSSDTWVQRAP